MKILHIVGARPNFMKAAPVFNALAEYSEATQLIVHTGQHYDVKMSDVFFHELGIPAPDINLQVGSGSHAVQTAEIMRRFEPVVLEQKPDWVLVYGDVNSTVAAALVCAKLGTRVGHVEAGLRSFDRSMPEEINRLVTDQLSDLLFTPSEDGDRNLAREGIAPEKVCFVGNVMIDSLIRMLPRVEEYALKDLPPRYVLVTLHRPANVDDLDWLKDMFAALSEIGKEFPVIFPVHPRTQERLRAAGLGESNGSLKLMAPVSYLTFLGLQRGAALVITDSGGIQEETTFLRVPCLTVRDNTERPITVDLGTNQLVGRNVAAVTEASKKTLGGQAKSGEIPPLWDGQASQRIAKILMGGKG